MKTESLIISLGFVLCGFILYFHPESPSLRNLAGWALIASLFASGLAVCNFVLITPDEYTTDDCVLFVSGIAYGVCVWCSRSFWVGCAVMALCCFCTWVWHQTRAAEPDLRLVRAFMRRMHATRSWWMCAFVCGVACWVFPTIAEVTDVTQVMLVVSIVIFVTIMVLSQLTTQCTNADTLMAFVMVPFALALRHYDGPAWWWAAACFFVIIINNARKAWAD